MASVYESKTRNQEMSIVGEIFVMDKSNIVLNGWEKLPSEELG